MKQFGKFLLVTSVVAAFFASTAFAEEIMGRCVAFDKDKNSITIVKDANNDKANPNFQLPPATFPVPAGTDVKAGKRIKLDTKENKLTYFDDATSAFKIIAFTLTDKQEGVEPTDARVASSKFPAIDKAKKTVTIYSKRQKVLTVLTVADDALALPEKTYDSGDDLKLTVEGGKVTKIDK